MRKFLCCFAALFLMLPTAVGAARSFDGAEGEEQAIGAAPAALSAPLEDAPFVPDASAVLLVEADSGRVIFEKNADIRRPVASLTKMMTLLLTVEAIEDGRLSLEDTVRVSKNAAGTGGSSALLDADSEYPAEVLLKSVAVASANDAAVALAEHVYGSEEAFVRRMNGRAAELGLRDTVYRNCTGLNGDGQYMTARDTAQLARVLGAHVLLREYSGIWMDTIVHPKNGRGTDLTNTNRLIRTYEGADGLKTGSTSEAMFCVAATAMRGGMRLIAVVLGASSSSERFSIAARMLDYGFDHYYLHEIAQEGAVVWEGLPVKGGSEKTVDIVAGAPVRAMIRKGEESSVYVETELVEQMEVPFAKGAHAGLLYVYRNEERIAAVPAVTAKGVENKGWIGTVLRVLAAWVS